MSRTPSALMSLMDNKLYAMLCASNGELGLWTVNGMCSYCGNP